MYYEQNYIITSTTATCYTTTLFYFKIITLYSIPFNSYCKFILFYCMHLRVYEFVQSCQLPIVYYYE